MGMIHASISNFIAIKIGHATCTSTHSSKLILIG